jgi:hypothetical protein
MIKKYNWIALAFFICFIFLWVFMFFLKENELCVTDFNKVDFKNLTDVDKFLLIDEIGNCIEDPEKQLQMLKKID